MDDKNLMENILLLQKSACGLFLHASEEASTQNVRKVFRDALDQALCMQAEIYDKMAAKGWYPTEQAEKTKIDAVKQKFMGA